jgi:diguanylate cyclase (GGDEF)-like protein/PAS domain S-box-containing protein
LLALVSSAVLEAFARLGSPVSAPEVLLFLIVMFAGYRWGTRSGLASALVAVLYLCYGFLSPIHPELSASATVWRVVAALILPASAALFGRLRDRFEILLQREREARSVAEIERERTARLLENMSDGYIAVDHEWRYTRLNGTAERLLGRSRESLIGTDARTTLPEPERSVMAQQYRDALQDGGPAVFETHSSLADAWFQVHVYPTPEGFSIFFRDISERRKHEERLHTMSRVDELTQLYNRRGFLLLAEQQCQICEHTGRRFILFFVDLDGLKRINDTLGHGTGDQAIVSVAEVLRSAFRESDVIARIGGDEFAALMLNTDESAAETILERLEAGIQERNASGLPFHLAVSCGVAAYNPENPCSVETLLRQADVRMYERKRRNYRDGADR